MTDWDDSLLESFKRKLRIDGELRCVFVEMRDDWLEFGNDQGESAAERD